MFIVRFTYSMAIYFGTIFMCGYVCGCGQREPDFITAQGVEVWDPRGHTNVEDVTIIIDCFAMIMDDYIDVGKIPTLKVHYVDSIDDVCSANSAGCTSRDEMWVLWLGGHDADATAHEMLHALDWRGPCGLVDKNHQCHATGPSNISPYWGRLGAVYGLPNAAHVCYQVSKGAF